MGVNVDQLLGQMLTAGARPSARAGEKWKKFAKL